jgi:hypothetical protein
MGYSAREFRAILTFSPRFLMGVVAGRPLHLGARLQLGPIMARPILLASNTALRPSVVTVQLPSSSSVYIGLPL